MSDSTGLTGSAWNQIFLKSGHIFRDPHPRVVDLLESGSLGVGAKVLDLGCGTGRHLVLGAARGYTVIGIDDSREALRLASELLLARGLSAVLVESSIFCGLPFRDGTLDAAVAVQSIHHACLSQIAGTISELTRTLKPGGPLFLSVPTLRNQSAHFAEIEPNTLVPLEGPEKGLPHHFFTEAELRNMLGSFEEHSFELDDNAHLCATAIRSSPRTSESISRMSEIE